MAKTSLTEARKLACLVARIAADDNADDVVVLDLHGITTIADFFVICTGTSDRQMRAIVDHVDEKAKPLKHKRYGLAGYEDANWILSDYVDVVLHVFTAEARSYYDLELLWGDARRITDWQETGDPRET
jgi:ribosome-associated protein